MNQTTQKQIIALFARGKSIGYVNLVNSEIYKYGVKTIREEKKSAVFFERVANSLEDLLETFVQSGVVVIERVDDLGRYGALTRAIPHVLKHSVHSGHSLMQISLGSVKQSLCDKKNASHQELIESIVHRYPIFLPLVKGVTPHKIKYWEKALMAVGLAEVAKSLVEKENLGKTQFVDS